MSKKEKISGYCGRHKGEDFLIVGAGSSIQDNRDSIDNFIAKRKPVIIGINNMTGFCLPTYHVWTNTKRLQEFGDNIFKESKLILSKKFPEKLKKKFARNGYVELDYVDEEGVPVDYREGRIFGTYRTAGCLSIMIAHLFGAKNIYIVGMDGYTLHGKKAVLSGEKSQHLYGKGFTDKAKGKLFDPEQSWEICLQKDVVVYKALRGLYRYGINFSIITPTKFKKFYNATIL